ncbi:MAG: DUF2914 domain-containing protein [Oligoflexia bacterium]|nr:DUF2914 domain-containing protein [Oligoflexia bacterium]
MNSNLKTKVSEFHQKYERYYNIAFFILGFLFDVLTLGRVDDLSNLLILGLYLALAKYFLLELYLKKSLLRYPDKIAPYIEEYRSEAFHFLIGALLSAMTIFFFKSSSNISSYLILFFVIFLMLINETPLLKGGGTRFKLILFLIALNSFFLVFFPVLIQSFSMIVFLGAQVLFIVYAFLTFHFLRNGDLTDKILVKHWIKPSLFIMSFFTITYFLKVIPPVPLHLQDIGIYHQVKKEYPKYRLTYKREPYRFWKNDSNPFYASKNDVLFVFTRVFAPKGFDQKVYLHWERKVDGDWKESDRIELKILGGREGGYRGYGLKKNYSPGDWRVSVKTELGLEIGKRTFSIQSIQSNKESLITEEIIDL